MRIIAPSNWTLRGWTFAAACLLVLATALKLHGWSLGAWRGAVDGSPTSEILIG